jgi:HD-like signal output (HDOD) protein
MDMLNGLSAEKLMAGIAIPPRPKVVMEIMEERSGPDPDLGRIAKLIGADVSIAAAALKAVNSPLFGLSRKVGSVEQAASFLGLNNIAALVTGLALRNSVPSGGLDRFWDATARTAMVAAFLAQRVGCASREDAHMFGLFRDCGIPLMMQRFPNYKETLQVANCETSVSFVELEDERHGTNHVLVGGLLAANWQLPAHLRQAIALHHEREALQSDAPETILNLVALSHVAQHIESVYSRCACDGEWVKLGESALAQLTLGALELDELSKDAWDLLQEAEY